MLPVIFASELSVIRFTLNDISSMTDEATFARGLDYFNRGRVVGVEYDSEGKFHWSEVKGSGRRVYDVVLLDTGDSLLSECSCPVRQQCKHGVATALAVLQQEQLPGKARDSGGAGHAAAGRAPGSWQRWLAELPPEPATEPQALRSGRQHLLYFLDVSHGEVQLLTCKAYLKKDGSWSQIKRYVPEYVYSAWSRPGYLQEEDVAILELLPRLSGDRIDLAGEASRLALNRMLATGRLYFGDRLVRQGAPKTLAWDWRETAAGGRQLQARLEGAGDWRLIDAGSPWYLDTDSAEVGEIRGDLPVAQLRHLLAMPPVDAGEVAEMAVLLRREIPRERLPLPVEPQLTIITTFTPHLTLQTREFDGLVLPGLTLHFDYGGFAQAPPYVDPGVNPAVPVERDGHYYQLERDLDGEWACCDRVEALGLYLKRHEDGSEDDIWLPDERNPAASLARWRQLEDRELPSLAAQGWIIEAGGDYHLEVQQVRVDMDIRDAEHNWFDFALALPIGDGLRLDTAAVVERWLAQGAPEALLLPIEKGWLELDTRPLQSIRGLLVELLGEKKLDKPVRLPAFQAVQLQDLPDLDQRQAPATRQLIEALSHFSGLEAVPAPAGLQAELRGYQQEGLNWLAFLQRYGFGGILADDMGLGKTLQTLALIQHLKDSDRLDKPALIVAPTSLTGNWMHESARFAPELKVTLIHGPERGPGFRQMTESDLVVTTYPLLLRDRERYKQQTFSLLVLDEAQAIKNPATKIAACVRAIRSDTRLCLSGTPLENHLGELWALLDFALPGLLGGRKAFNENYRKPIEKEGDETRQRELARRVRPFMLRRTKVEVVKELPPKTESVQYVELGGKQRTLYEGVRISMEKRIRDLVARQGMAKSRIEFLDALLKLRQACIDPRLVKLKQAAGIRESAKLDWLAATLPQLLEEGRRILIFSQFTQVLKLIEDHLKSQQVDFSKLTGQTRKRQTAIDRFQDGEVQVFLISLKAGGSGLNLTAADVVIHMDPWWNPAVENQATDRAHRIGQDKPVFVYKLVAADTVEERIHQMQQQKRALADALFDATGASALPQDKDALLALLS